MNSGGLRSTRTAPWFHSFPTGEKFAGPGNALLVTGADDAINDAYCTDPFYSYLTTPDGRCLVASFCISVPELGFTGRRRRSLVDTDTDNWAPRIGVAWRPFHTDRFVVRGGYGVFFDFLPLENLLFVNNNPITTPTQVYSTSFGTPPPGKVQQMFNSAREESLLSAINSFRSTSIPAMKLPTFSLGVLASDLNWRTTGPWISTISAIRGPTTACCICSVTSRGQEWVICNHAGRIQTSTSTRIPIRSARPTTTPCR